MPVSYKNRMTQQKGYAARKAVRRARRGVSSQLTRAIGGNISRALVSIPAALRARAGTGATEIKSIDGSNFATMPTFLTAGVVQQAISNMPIEGSSFYNRIGRRTRGISLEFHGEVVPTLGNAAAVPQQYARIMIIYDRQPNGALPAIGDVLLDYDHSGNTNTWSFSGLNMDNRDRYVVLRDRKILLPALGINGVASTTGSIPLFNGDDKASTMIYNEYIKLGGLETQYKASSSGAIGDVATGSYIMILISNADANATAAWKLQYNARYKFLD